MVYNTDDKTSRYQQLLKELFYQDEIITDLISNTLSTRELHYRFDASYGLAAGLHFTAWSTHRVYFATTYDGQDGVSSVSRHPTLERALIGNE